MAKGGGFERECAVLISKWWTEGERDDVFWRSDSSGARYTQRKKSGKDTAYQGGDLTFSDPIGEPLIKNWNIEIKTGYGSKTKIKDKDKTVVREIINLWDTLDIIDSQQKEPILLKMWAQCKRDAELTSRKPVLIFRRNRRKPCIMFSSKYVNHLWSVFGMYKTFTVMIVTPIDSCIIFCLKDFFEWIPDIRAALT